MDPRVVVEALKTPSGRNGRVLHAALAAAVAAPAVMTPHLLGVLRETGERAGELAGRAGYRAHLYAMLILAQFREVRACPLIVSLFSLPRDMADALGGVFIGSGLGRVLASVAGGDTTYVRALVEDDTASVWARGSAMRSIGVMAVTGVIPRTEAQEYFRWLFTGAAWRGADVDDEDILWALLTGCAVNVFPATFRHVIEQLVVCGTVDDEYFTADDWRAVESLIRDGPPDGPPGPWYTLIEDAIHEIELYAFVLDDDDDDY